MSEFEDGRHESKRRKLNFYTNHAPLGPALPLDFPPTTSIPNGPAHTPLAACRSESYDQSYEDIEPEYKLVCIGTVLVACYRGLLSS